MAINKLYLMSVIFNNVSSPKLLIIVDLELVTNLGTDFQFTESTSTPPTKSCLTISQNNVGLGTMPK